MDKMPRHIVQRAPLNRGVWRHPMLRLSELVALGPIMLLFGCSSGDVVRHVGPYSTKWVTQQIEAYEMPTKEAVSHVTRKVMYAGKPAYLIPSPCCDQFDYLYDSRGVILCAPSGGLAGRGDGRCPEVVRTAGAREL